MLENDRHERFCEEYLIDLNATEAYKRAYPEAGHDTARANAARLLADASVSDRVAEMQSARAQRVQLRLDDVLRELMLLAFSDVRHFEVDDLGHLLLREGSPDTAWRAVSSVKHRTISNGDFTTMEVEYKLWNKNDALKQLYAHLSQAGEGEGEDGVIPFSVLRKAMQRARERSA